VKPTLAKSVLCFLALALASPAMADDGRSDSMAQKVRYTPSAVNWGLDLQFSGARFTQWQMAPAMAVPGRNQGLHLGLDWLSPFPWGTLTVGIGVSGGIVTNAEVGRAADGSAIFASFTAVPVDASVTYRLDYFENQPLIPFGRIGLNSTFVGQTSRTGGEKPGVYAGFGRDLGVGLELSLGIFDRLSQNIFDSDFGVNHSYLVVEYLSSQSLLGPGKPDLSRDEIRLGLRFEL
jgi:hypothetical protein